MTGDELAAILTAPPQAGYPAWARFDPDFYRATNPTLGIRPGEDAAAAALRHYLQIGRFTGSSPNPWFDEAWYRARHAELEPALAAGSFGLESGFEHYLLAGHTSLSPHWLFDEKTYRNEISDHAVAATGAANHYDHYLRSGARRGLLAHPDFDPVFYLVANDVAEAALPATGAFGHYLERLWRERREGWTHAGIDLVAARADPATARAIAERGALGALHHRLATGAPPRFSPALATALRETLKTATASPGGLDLLGTHEAAGGRFVAGWLGHDPKTQAGNPIQGQEPILVALHHAGGITAARADLALFPRDDLAGAGDGFLAFIPAADGLADGAIRRIDVISTGASWRLAVPPDLPATPAAGLARALQHTTPRLPSGPATESLRRRLAHPVPGPASTLPALPGPIFLEIDEAVRLPNGDLILVGWHLAPPGAVHAIRLVAGWQRPMLALDRGIVMERPDVRDSVGRETGLAQLRCGFMLRVPGVLAGTATPTPLCIEVELATGAIGHRPLAVSNRQGIEAMRFLLDRTDPAQGNPAPPFDRVTGPAIMALAAARAAEPVAVERLDFGARPASPAISVIVALYGRVDFLDFQLGLEAALGPATDIERLYVLDDPPRARETRSLALAAHARFALPLSLLIPDENRGFAGANNIGLAHARGRYVCFLNSDVFPREPAWLARLAARLDADPTLGAIGARLLYEDGSIQHDGIVFRHLDRFGAWRFPDHPGKGMRPSAEAGLARAPAATAACLMMRRDLALSLGGFDEAYPIGDFEDVDLCMKLHAMGLGIAVDRDTVLYHLERQSQAGSAEHWRMQLTLFNAWQHERRWHRLLDRMAAP